MVLCLSVASILSFKQFLPLVLVWYCFLYDLLDYVWLLISWYSNPRDEKKYWLV